MPIAVRDRAESADRYWYFLVDAITVAFVIALMSRNSVPPASVGLRMEQWRSGLAIGMAAGIVVVLIQYLLVKFFPNATSGNATDYLRRRSIALWMSVFSLGAFAEEFWIALCLVAMRMNGHSLGMAIAVTASVFGAVHLSYRFGALAVAMKGAASGLIFIWCGSLIPMFLFHFMGNLGSLYWARHPANGPPSR